MEFLGAMLGVLTGAILLLIIISFYELYDRVSHALYYKKNNKGVLSMKTYIIVMLILVSFYAMACQYESQTTEGERGGYLEEPKSFYHTLKSPSIVIIGNSVGCGFYADGWETIEIYKTGRIIDQKNDVNTGWATQLRHYVESKGGELLNASQNGGTTETQLGVRYTTTNKYDVINKIIMIHPDYVIIPFQINDCYKHVPVSTFIINYTYIVKTLKDNGINVIVVLENSIDANGYIDYINASKSIANEFNVDYIDTYSLFLGRHELMYDSLHPNQAGHDLIFNEYKKYFDSKL